MTIRPNYHLDPSSFLSAEEATIAAKDNITSPMRQFAGGATRDLDTRKLDFEGFFSPLVMEAFAKYMNAHRETAAGLRDSDNWQAGFPPEVSMKSMWRHFMSLWKWHRGILDHEHPLAAMCGVLFNLQCMMKQALEKEPKAVEDMLSFIYREHIAREMKEENV